MSSIKFSYFISGHLDLTEKEFIENYQNKIQNAILNNNTFVVGDAMGADSLAQKYLRDNIQDKNKVTVYHMFDEPRNNFGDFPVKTGFKNDDERDAQMTRDSDADILWLRSVEEQKRRLGRRYNPDHVNGTMKNILRRHSSKKFS